MKIQIEKVIEVKTDRNYESLNSIIRHALAAHGFEEFKINMMYKKNVIDADFFIYYGSAHIAVHEILPTGEKSERLLLISK